MSRPELMRQARYRMHWTQQDVGRAVGRSHRQVSRWERGTAQPPEHLVKLLDKLFDLGGRLIAAAPSRIPATVYTPAMSVVPHTGLPNCDCGHCLIGRP